MRQEYGHSDFGPTPNGEPHGGHGITTSKPAYISNGLLRALSLPHDRLPRTQVSYNMSLPNGPSASTHWVIRS
ncbi:hypothetical protein SCLCIDRAFT_1216789 [Scleroderma citrinum Foug A]|uniref:Uncharacterized protein n=1 Tax=Scleroderma citrinum Foug A TaxID=1036808 RepID=A0A0C3A6R2_9AGAM|nr:hypothetical protein SCLCIDRAFT_1216789 [Scleroderma citrinum Foug A]